MVGEYRAHENTLHSFERLHGTHSLSTLKATAALPICENAEMPPHTRCMHDSPHLQELGDG